MIHFLYTFEILIHKLFVLFFYSLFGDMLVDKQSLLCNHIHGHYCDSYTSGISVEWSSVEFDFLWVVLFSVFSGMMAVAAEVNHPFLPLCTPHIVTVFFPHLSISNSFHNL